MSDAIGASWLPALAPTRVLRGQSQVMTTRAVGDPALVTLGSFVATVMQAQLGTAWTALDSRAALPIAGAVDGTRSGLNVVRRVYYHNPRKGNFVADDLPGLFVYRFEAPEKAERFAQDAHRRQGAIGLLWLASPAPSVEIQRTERDPFNNVVSGSLHHALTFKRHPSWTIAEDDAAPEGMKTSFATSTSPVTVTVFNGSLAGATMRPPRSASITTAAAPGAYSTDPIWFAGVDEFGKTFRDSVVLSADGGETAPTVQRFARYTEVTLPAMLLATGAITLGYWDSYEKPAGSLVQRACGFSSMVLREVRRQPFEVLPDKGVAAIPMVGVEAILDVGEDEYWDPDVHARTPYDVEAHVRRTDVDIDFTSLEIDG